MVKALAAQHDSCRRLGWGGPLVALQVEVSGEQREGFEFCTASVAFVSEDFKGLSRLAVAARCFRGKVTSATTEAWIREVLLLLYVGLVYIDNSTYLSISGGFCECHEKLR